MRKKGLIGVVILVVIVLVFVVGAFVVWNFLSGISGRVVEGFGGPSVEDSECLRNCVVVEGGSEDVCMAECGVAPEPSASGDEGCMQECVNVGCDEYDVGCVQGNVARCEDECGMIGEPEARNEEEQCIRDCVNVVDSGIECSSGTFEGEGETGNAVCRECARSCEHLYSGPCLSDEEWTMKEDECSAQCEHCYGEPVMGDSGQGWECTVDIECADASGEFGDDAGSGPGIGDEGYVAPNVVMKIVDSVVGFFKGLFFGGRRFLER